MFHFFRVIRRSAVRQVVHNFRGQHFVASIATALANASEKQEHVGCTEKNVFQNSVIVLDGYGALPWLGQGWYVDVGFQSEISTLENLQEKNPKIAEVPGLTPLGPP